MRKIIFSWFTFWVVVSGLIFYLLWPLQDNLRFGMDLLGGSFLTLEVQADRALEEKLKGIAKIVPTRLKKEGKVAPAKVDVSPEGIVLTFSDLNAANDGFNYMKDNFTDLVPSIKEKVVSVRYKEVMANAIRTEAVDINVDVLKKRLNRLDVSEILVSKKGDKQIIIELPGVKDPQVARAMIGKPAILEFKLIEKTGRTKEDILYEYDGIMPDGMEIIPDKNKEDGKPVQYYLVSRYADLKGSMLIDARPGVGGRLGNQPVVKFKFSSEGGEIFYDLTSKNPGRQLGIVLDEQVISAPVIQSTLRTEGEISGNFTPESSKELSMLLRSGALVAPVSVEEDRQIGATLGAESVKKGLFSCLIGLALIFLFCLIYYKVSGLLAFFALVFNLGLVLFGLHSIDATLTLPGIAGMILTVGMAIDSSILIFERIKEALRSGVSIKKAVNTGFANATAVILDANITTFIVGIVLYQFGTGPLRGFAVTMMLGIVATLITGLIFLRTMFNFVLNALNVKKLGI